MPPKLIVSDTSLCVCVAAWINCTQTRMHRLRSFPKAAYKEQIRTLLERTEDPSDHDVNQLLRILKFHVLGWETNFVVAGVQSKLSIRDVLALAKYRFDEDRGT